MDAGVEAADRPDGGEPCEEPGEARGPRCEVVEVPKDVLCIVALVSSADGEGDDGCGNEDEICAVFSVSTHP